MQKNIFEEALRKAEEDRERKKAKKKKKEKPVPTPKTGVDINEDEYEKEDLTKTISIRSKEDWKSAEWFDFLERIAIRNYMCIKQDKKLKCLSLTKRLVEKLKEDYTSENLAKFFTDAIENWEDYIQVMHAKFDGPVVTMEYLFVMLPEISKLSLVEKKKEE